MTIKKRLFFLAFLACQQLLAQDTLSVLFLGNSYTSYNNLPQLVQSVSSSAGKTLIIDSNMPGGMTISGHLNDPTSMAKLNQGNWDYVVIQEQSQIPSIDYYRYNDMYPALDALKDVVLQTNPCTKIITYMTWGRRFGGQQCDPSNTYCSPVFADFNHMQDSLTSAYTQISNMLQVQCAPVGETWRSILNDTSLVLHINDNSHPNIDGSYVAALTLYSAIWKKPSSGISFNAGIAQARALYYQQKSDATIYNNPGNWNFLINNPLANFTFSVLNNTATFTNTSSSALNNPLEFSWNFGDGSTSALQNPTHTYAANGLYNVTLVAKDCFLTDTVSFSVQIGPTGMAENETSQALILPNPFSGEFKLSVNSGMMGKNFYISDLSGRLFYQGNISTQITSVDLENLPTGFYLLSIDGEGLQNIRLLKY